MKRKSPRLRAWLLLLVWIVVTVTALSVPIPKVPKIVERGLDKALHTALFVVMGVLGQAAAPLGHLFLTGPVAFGVEWLQRKLPGRYYSTVDLAANFLGLLVGIGVFELSIRLKR
ncbi:MAG: hypothetical protein ABIK44_00615 [candidate division WOR-3 bacterium]